MTISLHPVVRWRQTLVMTTVGSLLILMLSCPGVYGRASSRPSTSLHRKLQNSKSRKSPAVSSSPRRRHADASKTHRHSTNDDLLIVLRGGATYSSKAISIEDDEDLQESSFLVSKLRNILRSLLDMSERKSPTVARVARSFLKTLESITGVRLLPIEKPKKKKRSKRGSSAESKTQKKKAVIDKAETKAKAKSDDVSPLKKKSVAKSSKPTQATAKHLNKPLTSKHANYRIQRELKEFIKSPPPNLAVKVGSNIRIWIITLTGAKGTVYEGETYKLRVQFPASYPTVPPSVYFLAPPPQHEHVYTNGDICLSLLGDGWRPSMTAQSIAVSILSILSSAQTKSLPMDNARHSQEKPGQYQKGWVYHDDNC